MVEVSIALPDDLKDAVDEAVAQGQFPSRSEYLANLIRRDRDRIHEEHEAVLRQRLESTPVTEMTDADFDRIRQRLEGEIARRRGQ